MKAEQEIKDRVTGLIVKQLGVSEGEVIPEKSFADDLGADSLDVVELVMAIEEEFGFEIPEDDANAIRTVGDAIAYIVNNCDS